MEKNKLERLNQIVKNFDLQLNNNIKNKEICFIIALPKGGSTFLQQILISKAHFTYISNLAAKFWQNPTLGLWLQKQLNFENFCSNFKSEFGSTFGPLEPHEFGWFWENKLNLNKYERINNPISWARIEDNLENMMSVFDAPLIIDSPYVSSNFIKFSAHFKNAKYIIIDRDIWSVCNSICNSRILKYGDISSFYGAKPYNFKELIRIKNPIEQVVNQVYNLDKEIQIGLSNLNQKQFLRIPIVKLRKNPNSTAERIIQFIENKTVNLVRKQNKLPHFPNRDKLSPFSKKYENELQMQVKKFF